MTKSFPDALVSRLLQIDLIDGVTHDEHIIDTNTHEQEWHELMHPCASSPAKVHQSKARSVCKHDANDSTKGHKHTTVNRAECTKHEECVDADHYDGDTNHLDIILDIQNHGLEKTKDREEMRRVILNFASLLLVLQKLIIGVMELFFKTEVRLFVNLMVSRVLDLLKLLTALAPFRLLVPIAPFFFISGGESFATW